MAPQPDPYRTLGLPRGAPVADVKAAYRRLAKAFHPDTAGEKAMPRFLAIQEAYDSITGSERRTGSGRGTASGPPRREPWHADPGRARATPGAGSGKPGAASDPGRSSNQSQGSQGTTGAGNERGRGRRPGSSADSRRPGSSADSRRPGSSADGQRPGSGRSRLASSSGRATPGSTTYDTADSEPFNPEWSGASWYGTTSGTYWTLNPKEYADPRKHGPEYQARARRASSEAAGGPRVGETSAAADGEPGRVDTSDASSAEERESVHAADDRGDRSTQDPAREPRYRPDQAPHFRPASTGPSSASSTSSGPPVDGLGLLPALPLPPGLPSRVALALLGWPPLGFALATFISEASGCGRFAASCVETFDFGTWVGQLAILGLLLAVPRLASISAIGTVAMLAAAVPGAVLLSATGGAQNREAAVGFLTAVLIGAYVIGVIAAVVRVARTMRT